MTTHLWARPCGGLTHAEDWLVLDTIQPTNRKAGAADPSHHGYVAVSEEAMHGEIDWKGVQMNGERKKESKKSSEEKRGAQTCDQFWEVASKVFKVYSVFSSQRCGTWSWESQEASSPECELDHTDSPQTDWLMGSLSQPVSTKNNNKILQVFLSLLVQTRF